MMENVSSLTSPDYIERFQDTPWGPSMARPTAGSPILVPNGNVGMPASTSIQERQLSPPIQTIDPNVLRPPSYPIPPERDARSVIIDYIMSSDWLAANMKERNVGGPGVPGCASQLATSGSSVFMCCVAKIKRQGVTKYKCIECNHIVDRIDRALEHQRSKRDHKPFACPQGW
jgi:hypothetical protein